MDVLTLSQTVWEELHTYLDNPIERMAFLAAVPHPDSATSKDLWSVVDVMYLDDESDYEHQGQAGMELVDDIRPRSLQWATQLGAALIEVHSHGSGRSKTTFSTLDLRGLLDGAPRLVWRLRGRPYGAIVFGGRRDFDALVWYDERSTPVVIAELAVEARSVQPTACALERIAQLEALDG
ncbi:hypothetical protein ABZS29_26775 [Kribbella sp. NPDC005582]|uniref:hypothetical protein n=1 Tax=Kribbella sp. NPDC005582 TaxID=3156893 RepID=UPI0033BD8271